MESKLQTKRAVCVYSDGSTHEKMVEWDEEALCRVDVNKLGSWKIPGKDFSIKVGNFNATSVSRR